MKKITEPTAADAKVGERVLLLRKAKGWDQAQLCTALAEHGVTVQATTISRTENGKRAATSAELDALAKAFGVRVVDLVRGTERPAPRPMLVPEPRAEARFTEYDVPELEPAESDARVLAKAIDNLSAVLREGLDRGLFAA